MSKIKKIGLIIAGVILLVSLAINVFVILSNFNLHHSVNQLTLLYQEDKRFDELKDNYNKLLAHLLYLKGKDAIKLNRFEDAMRLLKESIKANPKVSLSHYELATLSLKENNISEALEYSLKESENNPAFIDNLNLLGTLYYLNEQFEDASKALEKLLLLQAENRDAVNNLSEAYRQLDFPAKAVALIENYQRNYDPENKDFMLEFKKRMSFLQDGKLDLATDGFPRNGSDEKLSTLALTILAGYNYLEADLKMSTHRLELAQSKDERNLFSTLVRDKIFENHPYLNNSNFSPK